MPETPLIWHGCYEKSWNGIITPDAFSHPAKLSRSLTERIYAHMMDRGWLVKGQVVGDCFGGVACGGIVAGYLGLHWVGVELEPRFCKLGNESLAKHRPLWEQHKLGSATLLLGDSRNFHEILLAGVDAVCSSPPYADSIDRDSGIDPDKVKNPGGPNGNTFHKTYGDTNGQIGQLKNRGIDSVISSPPYSAISAGAGGLNTKPAKKAGQQSGRKASSSSQDTDQRYGSSEGQIAKLKDAGIDSVVSSPPWESNCDGGIKGSKLKFIPPNGKGHYASDEARAAQLARDESKVYGDAAGQIGNTNGQTYWSEMLKVYSSVRLALKPGGYVALIVKNYVKNKKEVDLCGDTTRLMVHLGFEFVEKAHAMLVKEHRSADIFGGEIVKTKQRKSFFRRLAESKGSPRIDYEQVLFFRKPL